MVRTLLDDSLLLTEMLLTLAGVRFGWLYSKEVVDAGIANLGLRDQRLALHWIQENIGAFGGDREKVYAMNNLSYDESSMRVWSLTMLTALFGVNLPAPSLSARKFWHTMGETITCFVAP